MTQNQAQLAFVDPGKGAGWGQIEWKSYVWAPVGQGPMRRASGARVATLARQVIALERARSRRGKLKDLLLIAGRGR